MKFTRTVILAATAAVFAAGGAAWAADSSSVIEPIVTPVPATAAVAAPAVAPAAAVGVVPAPVAQTAAVTPAAVPAAPPAAPAAVAPAAVAPAAVAPAVAASPAAPAASAIVVPAAPAASPVTPVESVPAAASTMAAPAAPAVVTPVAAGAVTGSPADGAAETPADPWAPEVTASATAGHEIVTSTTGAPVAPAASKDLDLYPTPMPFTPHSHYVSRKYARDPEDYQLGVGLMVGGGVTDFTHSTIRDLTATGGSWDARLIFGVREVLALEAAYVGSARDISARGLSNQATLVGNGAEGVLRLNIPVIQGRSLIEPFGFAGIGWSRYQVTKSAVNNSNVGNDDDVLEIPYGAGLLIGYGGFLADARFTYRATYYNDLLRAAGDPNNGRLDSWAIAGHIGFEF